jgi:hypothetical protein
MAEEVADLADENERDLYRPYERPRPREAKPGLAKQYIREGRAILEQQGKRSA